MSVETQGPQFTEVDYDPFAEPQLQRAVTTTEAQREVWLADQFGREASLAYNESSTFRLRGRLVRVALESALHELVRRHDALRSTLSDDGLSLYVQAVASMPMAFRDLAADTPEAREAAVAALCHAEVETPFDIQKGPLARVHLLRLQPEEHVLVFTAHHIVCDGWSLGVIAKDLGALYSAVVSAVPVELHQADQFSDLALAQAAAGVTPDQQQDERFWIECFGSGTPVLDLPSDRARPAMRTFASDRVDVWFDTGLVEQLRRFSGRQGCSLYGTLLAGFAGLMSRLSGQHDLVVGVPAAGQLADDKPGLVGHCVNLLPVRFRFDAAFSGQDLLRHGQARLLDAFEHQRCTFGTLLKKLPLARDPSRPALVSVMFNLDQALDSATLGFADLDVAVEPNPRRYENFELFVNASQIGGALRLECQYNSDLFDATSITTWMEGYEALLRGLMADPARAFSTLDFASPRSIDELHRLNATAAAFPRSSCVDDLVAGSVRRVPDAIALTTGTERLSYAELDAKANRLTHWLRGKGVGRGALVGLCVERGVEMVVAQLAVLRSGAAYVPLDPAYPADRLAYMAEDAQLALLVTESSLVRALPWPRERAVLLDLDATRIEAEPSTPPQPDTQRDARPEDPAYVIYTSGSTGRPKGVVVPHRSVVNFLSSMAREPGLEASDRLVAVTTLSFDIAVLELLLPLSVGAQVVLASRDQVLDGQALKALLEQSQATVMQATPSGWRLLLESGWRGGPGFKALVGGEALSLDLAQRLLQCCGELWNMYGPTETTVWSTCWKVQQPERGIVIGRPIANTGVWVLDERGQACPIGVPGELCIGGDGLAVGYLRREELTAERFIADPQHPGQRLYRTGDRGRWRHDGQLEHLGRLDFQVKVRGHRIELGEIEAALASHPGVAQAVVIVREDEPGDVRLVAYHVARGVSPEAAALREHLRGTLPEYMLPQHHVSLPAIPLLPNGKIDRKSLPRPQAQEAPASGAFDPPRTATEKQVAALMGQVLRLPAIGVSDSFFALGGHSLVAAQFVARLGREIDMAIPMRTVFEAPTVQALAAWIDARRAEGAEGAPVIARLPDPTRAPASLMQQRLWFLDQIEPGRVTYNTPSAHRLTGALDVAALEGAFDAMLVRQTALRTVLEAEDDLPMQRVLPPWHVSLQPVDDLAGLPEPQRSDELQRRMQALADVPFDLITGPLFTVRLFRLAPQEHVLFFMTHHIIWDGWSFDLFYEEMAAHYGALTQGRTSALPALPALPVSYGDFSAWHLQWLQGKELQAQVDHWKARLHGAPSHLDLPLDRPRPSQMSGGGDTEALRIPDDLVALARRHAQAHGATMFMTLFAAFALLLQRLSGQDDLVVGTPVRGRHSPEVEKVMGFFVNALPLRVQVDPAASFDQLLARVRGDVVDAFNYQDVPFEHLVRELKLERDESRSPLYQAFFSFQDARMRIREWGTLRQEQVLLFQHGAAEDLGLWFLERVDGVVGGLSYNTDVFSRETAAQLGQTYFALLRAAFAAPSQPVARLDLHIPEQAERLQRWNDTRLDVPHGLGVAAFLAVDRAEHASRIAVASGHERLSYAELDAKANRLTHWLRGKGVGRGALVGLCVERGVEMVVAQLAVLRSGAAYVPLDPAYPADRLAYMAEDAQLALLVTESSLVQALPWPRERAVLLDLDATRIEAEPSTPPQPDTQRDARPEDPAYVIYTSGSTGRPKGVVVPHRSVVNFLSSMAREPGLEASDRLVAVTTLSFDIAVLELLLPLSVGAQVVLASRDQVLDGQALKALLEQSQATVMQATPSGWRLLLESGWRGGPGFKALVGGEALSLDLAQRLLQCCGELWNMYGPTETTVWSTCWKVQQPERGIVIGRPIANTGVWVLDERGQACPIGVPGELCIGGDGLAVGYLRREELTAERFIADPQHPGQRLYRTGDRGRWRHDGQLEHLGRLDFQVKVRGHRIELGEIEAALASHPGVAQAVVIVREDEPGDVRLVAYHVARGVSPEAAALREHLRGTLPEYMLPQHHVSLPAIPLLPNGKIDRKSLPVLAAEAAVQVAARGRAMTEAERVMASIWGRLLGIRDVQPTDNFFDLGGHSLLAMRAVSEINKQFATHLPVRRLIFESLAQISTGLEGAAVADVAARTPAEAEAKPGLMGRLLRSVTRRGGRDDRE